MRRRLACDYERNAAHSEIMIRWAMTDVILRDSPEANPPHAKARDHYGKPPRSRPQRIWSLRTRYPGKPKGVYVFGRKLMKVPSLR